MKPFAIKAALVMIMLSSVLTWLYLQSRQAGSESLFQITSLVQEIVAIDSSMERDVLRLKVGSLRHYDTITDGSEALDNIFHELKSMLESIPELKEELSALEASITVQKSSLGRFKRSNSLLRNSLRYFPVAINDVMAKHPKYYSLLVHLYHDLLQASTESESITVKHLKRDMDLLREGGHEILARHLLLIVKRSSLVEESIFSFIHCGTEENSEALLRAYGHYHDLQLKKSEWFRLMLAFFSALLVLFIGFVVYRLLNAASELKNAVAELQYQKFALDEHAIVAVTDQKGDITYANQKFCEISGYSQEELLGKDHRIVKSDHHPDEFYKQMWRTIASGKAWHGEIKNRSKSGKFYWVDSTIVPFLNAQGKPYKYVAIRTDITARKETEETYKKLTAAFYYAAEALMITDSAGLVEHVNPAFEQMTGYSDVEIQGKSETMLRSSEHDESFYEGINEALHRGEVWKGEMVLLCKDRSEKTTLRSLAPVLNEKGELINYVTIMTDITEENFLRSKLEHAQRLESLGVLAGGIAHDFNNILTSIMGNAKLAEGKMADGNRESFPYLKRISKASERAADLCRQMLAYSGQGNVEMRSINLSELVDEITTLLEVSVADKTSIHYHLATQLPAIHADTGQLQQVVMNLITNARESYPDESGDVWVDVGEMDADKNWISTCVVGDNIDEGRYVYVEVKDSGSGMDEATLEKVFEPFFTTKFTGRGLGMSAMMGIVKAHHGAIHIDSELGQGTIIRVVFPAVDQQAETLADDVPEAGEHAKAVIMIVDDEADILEYAKAVLTDLGHDVVTAISGEQALEMFQQEERRIDLVITDATMPGMSGEQLCQQLNAIDEGVKLILSSGYDANDLTLDIQSELLSGFIQKPYSPEKFAHEVFKVLEG